MKKIVAILAVLVLLQLMIVPAGYAAPPVWGGQNDCGDTCYTVQYGDTLFSIARRFGVDVYYLAQFNGLYSPNCIYAGQVLYIPTGSSSYFWGQSRPIVSRTMPAYPPIPYW